MVKSAAKTVDDYISESSPERAKVQTQLRELIHKTLQKHVECMQWGMPTYTRDGNCDVAFANQKQYLSVYFLKQGVFKINEEALRSVDHGKGCLRFRNVEKIDFALIEKLLRDTAASSEQPC
jgi:uncharacterized protein YdhG (YjbR/CyaY superfamily)